jgi:hypothetical protein
MRIAVRVGKTAAAIALALPIVAQAQYTGVSHPDDPPFRNTPDTHPQPPIQSAYQALPAPEPAYSLATPPTALKPHPGIPMDAEPAPVVDSFTPQPAPYDPDAGIVTHVAGPANRLPIGTLVKVALRQEISTATTRSGTAFSARLIAPMERDGHVLIPAGSTLSGLVTEIHSGKRISGAASIHLRTTSVTLPDGTRYHIRGQVIDTNLVKEVKDDREGTIFGRDRAGKTAAAVALPVASGAAAGAMIAGVPGAVVGAGVGAGVSTVVWLKQDRHAELPVDTELTFSLVEPLTVGGGF